MKIDYFDVPFTMPVELTAMVNIQTYIFEGEIHLQYAMAKTKIKLFLNGIEFFLKQIEDSYCHRWIKNRSGLFYSSYSQ
uniref:Les22 n=1 Tax=Arundo donax TaxID=35708 RepID=A0A0A9DPQ8_ARUDO